MSTRAVYSVTNSQGESNDWLNVYIHHDGYPTGAVEHIKNALQFAWKLPRFEADEFAAALCAGVKARRLSQYVKALEREAAGNKSDNAWDTAAYHKKNLDVIAGGAVRIFPSGTPHIVAPENAADLEFRYEIRCIGNQLHVKAFDVCYWDEKKVEKGIFQGPFDKFAAWAAKEEADAKNERQKV